MHSPIFIRDLSLSFSEKVCFEDFSTEIHSGQRIAIIGRNGSGKSSLLKLITGEIAQTFGRVEYKKDCVFGYVPQVILNPDASSGGEHFNQRLSSALRDAPNILMLDEPTNHLDITNRRSLMRMLQKFSGTLILVTHDPEVLRTCVDTLWNIEGGKVEVFSGNYDHYMHERLDRRRLLESELSALSSEKKSGHESLMKEQARASKSKAKGQKSIDQKKWPTVVSKAKAGRAQETSGQKKANIQKGRRDVMDRLSELRRPDELKPTFSILGKAVGDGVILNIREGVVRYGERVILEGVYLSLLVNERVAIVGNNGSGKSTLMKAILDERNVRRLGDWTMPKLEDIGSLDQHYGRLSPEKTVFEVIAEVMVESSHAEVRRHLNAFLFRTNEEVAYKLKHLSGGELVRVSLAKIAARVPKLLLLDEVNNNLDLETRQHVIDVLREYPGAMLLISHDADFLEAIGVSKTYVIEGGGLVEK